MQLQVITLQVNYQKITPASVGWWGKVDRVLLFELNCRAGGMIGLEADNSGSFVVYFDRTAMPRSVSVAIRTVFLLPEEEGTVLGAPRGVSHCRDITNFAIVPYHTRQGRSPGTLHCNAAYDPHQ